MGSLFLSFMPFFCFLYLGKGENWSNENNKSVKWVKNLHFLKHRTLDILIYKSCTFLVFEDFDSLCKFVIFSEHKSGDKIKKKSDLNISYFQRMSNMNKVDMNLQIPPMARSRDVF